MDQAVSMLLVAQHSAWLTSVCSTRLQVASRPCWSQQTPPVDKGDSDHWTRGALLCRSQRPGLPPSSPPTGDAYSWCSVITQGMILLPTWEGGAETCTGAPIPAPLSIPLGFFLLSEPYPTHNPHSWWEALPTPPPTLLQAPRPPGPGLASCPTSQTLRARHAGVSGPWSPLSASALCLDRARGHAEPPSPSSPPLPGPPLTHSNLGTFSLHELTSPWGHGLRGGGSALPFMRGWGGAAGWGRKADSPQSLHP